MKKKIIILIVVILLFVGGGVFWWWQAQPKLRQLTFDWGNFGPRFNPDGKEIVFESDKTGNNEIWIMNQDDTNQRQLTFDKKKENVSPSFSPDGKEIVFVSNRTGNWDVWIMNRDGTNQRQLTFGENIDDAFPSFSSDGKEVVFVSDKGDINKEDIFVPNHIWIMNRDGTNQRQLTFGENIDVFPSFSPDGKEIVFYSDRDDIDKEDIFVFSHVWIMNRDGTNQRQLTFGEFNDSTPLFNLDGEKIVFHSNRGDINKEDIFVPNHIWIMNRDGTNQRQLTFGENIDVFPSFSPDGKEIVFSSNRGGNFNIWLLELR
jgi:Tol biopolymer transport system component